MSCSDENNPNKFTLDSAVGEDVTWEFEVKNEAGAFVDLTDAQIFFTIRRRLEDVAPVVAKKNALAGGSDDQARALDQVLFRGHFQVYLLSSETGFGKVDPKKSPYKYDAWVIMSSGEHVQITRPPRDYNFTPAVTRF